MIQTFKTDINCSSCVRAVSGFLDGIPGVTIWRVDVNDPNKLLLVEGQVSQAAILEAVRNAGYDIEPISSDDI